MTLDWQDLAECRDLHPDLFFDQDERSIAAAKLVCRRCPAIKPCGDDAVARGERWGTWGGLSEADRQRARRKRQMMRRTA